MVPVHTGLSGRQLAASGVHTVPVWTGRVSACRPYKDCLDSNGGSVPVHTGSSDEVSGLAFGGRRSSSARGNAQSGDASYLELRVDLPCLTVRCSGTGNCSSVTREDRRGTSCLSA
jgi:hypothetical protein